MCIRDSQKTVKTYEYHILNREFPLPAYRLNAHFTYRPLDIARMQEAARYLEGEHDFQKMCIRDRPGTAVSQVKIDGVLHEFSSIPGVKEDVTEIIMNIKSLSIKNNSDSEEAKVAYIDFEGEGVVTAGDIQCDPDIEILNPDLVIAHLNLSLIHI